MPNRIIKESICTSENVDQLTPFQETFFYRLIVNCDDYGRMDARPKILSARLYPLKDVRANQIDDALRALAVADLVLLYEVDGKPFLQMRTWDRHQQVRAKRSKYPHPDEGICNQLISDDCKCPRNPIQSNPNPNPNPNTNSETQTRFIPPTVEQVREYCQERGNNIDPEYFVAYYENRDWKLTNGRKIKDWKLSVITWEKNNFNKAPDKQQKTVVAQQYEQRSYSEKPETMTDVLRRLQREQEEQTG
jgi:hypothetical protein